MLNETINQDTLEAAHARNVLREKSIIGRNKVEHPSHYTSHPSGVECIEITRHMGFNLGNAFKYIWRCDLKEDAIEDLEKAIFYLRDEIRRRKSEVDRKNQLVDKCADIGSPSV